MQQVGRAVIQGVRLVAAIENQQGKGAVQMKESEVFVGKHTVVRNTLLLSGGMAALYGMNQLTVAVATQTFSAVTGLNSLSGLGPAIFLGMASLAALVAGHAMDRLGRIPVLAGGFVFGLVGCLLTGLGASLLSVAAVVGGFGLLGAATGTVMLSRTAAADMYPPERRAQGIGLVLFGAVFGALLGPLVFAPLFASEGAHGHSHGGHLMIPWLVAGGFMLAGLILILNVRPDPKRIGALLTERERDTRSAQKAEPLGAILRRPGVAPALLAAVASFSVMVGTMTLAGYILMDHGHHEEAVFPVISAHFVGMFGLTFLVGHIIDRVGRVKALVGGLSLLGLSVLSLVWTVETIAATSVALFGVGLGWNFSYVAATAELTERTTSSERGKILGFADLLSNLLGAAMASLGVIVLATVGLAGFGVAGLALAVAPAFWLLHAAFAGSWHPARKVGEDEHAARGRPVQRASLDPRRTGHDA
jgi:MFS family permease